MFIDILRSAGDSLKEVKTVIIYKADGNSVKTVKKELINLAALYNDNTIQGMYADGTEPENGIIIYKDFDSCLEVQTLYNEYTADQIQKALQNYNGKMPTFSDFENAINNIINEDKYIKNDVLYLLELHGCKDTIKKALKVKEGIKAKAIAEQAEKERQRAEEKRKREETEAEEKKRQRAEKIDFLHGYEYGKTQIQIERIYNVLSKIQGYRSNGKTEYKSRKDFIIDILSEGGRVEQKDGVISYYGSKWDKKQSKPKTEYRLYTAEGRFYTVTKIEYDFACYIMQKSA